MTQLSDKTILEIPNSVESEDALIGALIQTPEMLPRVKAFFLPEAFYLTRNRWAYEAILHLHDKRMGIDPVTLANFLAKAGNLDDMGGPAVITDYVLACPTGYHAESYAADVMVDYIKRQGIEIATWLAQASYAANGNISDIMTEARSKILEASGLLSQDDKTMDLKASAGYYMDVLEQRLTNQDKPKLKFNLFPTLNKLMPELGIGDLVSVLAESGVGKTAFLEDCTEDWAKRGWRGAFFHLELNEQTMLDRRMQRATGIPIAKLREPERFGDEDWTAVIGATDKIDRWPGNIHYVHCPGWTVDKIIAKAIELNETDGLDFIIVDYFNKIRTEPTSGMNYAQARGFDIETLKTAIEDNHWRCLLAAQFDKAARHQKFKRGSDARDTGELEQKSNVIIVIDRPLEDGNQRSKFGQIQVVKCNAGREGSVSVKYYGKHFKYGELTINDALPEHFPPGGAND